VPLSPRLIDFRTSRAPEGIVLVLHGGASRRRTMRVSPAQLSVLRMIPVARRVARVAGSQVVVQRLLNSHRGWDTGHTPVRDVDWALAQTAARFGHRVPVCLVGHSLGGRAALLSAGRPGVRGVVALAPWVLPSDTPVDAAGTHIVVIHGDADRIASPERSRQIAERLRRQTAVSFVSVRGGTHAMLRRRDAFDGLAARCAAWMLLGTVDDGVIGRLADGEPILAL
jgi:pimeloyl-ACP methyl ester carboxylesterase